MLSLPNALALLLCSLGLVEFASQKTYGHGGMDLAVALTAKVGEHVKQGLRGTDVQQVQEPQTFLDHHHQHMQKEYSFEAMSKKMEEMKQCHHTCGHDHDCHEKCPKPWLHLQQKCEKFEPILSCHKKCWHDHACHMKCPLPTCPKKAEKIKMALQCHGACAHGDHDCHRNCPRPFHMFAQKCQVLQESLTCHKGCDHGDVACHHACPKMMKLWEHSESKEPLQKEPVVKLLPQEPKEKLPVVELTPEVAEQVHHQESWGFHDEHHDNMRLHRFHMAMGDKMRAMKKCHMDCKHDDACHKACPKPWKSFEEKCDDVQAVQACHKSCHHDHACHVQCPLPKCPKLAEKVKATIQCHEACAPGDHSCHHSCHSHSTLPEMSEKCQKLHDVLSCHKECGLVDFKCHHSCPKMFSLWHKAEPKHEMLQV
eukprot:CAMPEP_0170614116 /NCGR_PEP_ID=MMETSP0224-20130122/24628_1 /TAXON_ID=285029 /ORGANISM="Togula jolla, Strain CCCM 725" /LENGTH=424 /DNA_ID=CAMNT_0010939751 /DNA_START=60 /DNA_END=1334 /DNA_ORIENTATION=+